MSSIFFAKFFGLFFLIIGILMLVRIVLMRTLIKDTIGHPLMLFFSGILSILIGLVVVITHNIWMGWSIVITIIGWLLLITGILRLYYPEGVIQMGHSIINSRIYWGWIWTAIVLLVALFLCYHGFYLAR